MFFTIRKRIIIPWLILISVFLPAYSEIVGGFFFEGKSYFIEKKDNVFFIKLDGREIERFDKLYSYGCDGENLAVFLTENYQIVWHGKERVKLKVKPSVFFKYRFPVFKNFFVQNGKQFVFIADSSPYLFDMASGKKYFLPSLVFLDKSRLRIVPPEKIFIFNGNAFYYSSGRLLVYSLSESRFINFKKLTYSNFNFAELSGNKFVFFFDENNYKVVFDGKGFKEEGKTTKKGIYFYKGTLGNTNNCFIKAEFSAKGLSSDFQIRIKVKEGNTVRMDEEISGFSLKEKDLLEISKPFFYPLEKVVVFHIPGGFNIVIYKNEKGKFSLKVFDGDKRFYVVNGIPKLLPRK